MRIAIIASVILALFSASAVVARPFETESVLYRRALSTEKERHLAQAAYHGQEAEKHEMEANELGRQSKDHTNFREGEVDKLLECLHGINHHCAEKAKHERLRQLHLNQAAAL